MLNVFRSFANKYKIDQSGDVVQIKGKKVENLDAITDSWEIPVVLISTDSAPRVTGYRKIMKIGIEKESSEISTLVSKTAPRFISELNAYKIKHTCEEILANRLFYDWINEAK